MTLFDTVSVTLAAGATASFDHGLGIDPDYVMPDKSTALVVNSADSSSISVTNPGSVSETVVFEVSRRHSIIRTVSNDWTPLLWQGGGGAGPPGEGGAFIKSNAQLASLIAAQQLSPTDYVVQVSPGTYALTKSGAIQAGIEYAHRWISYQKLLLRGAPGGESKFTFVSSNTIANYCHAIILDACEDIEFQGITFQGSTSDDSYLTNYYAAVALRGVTKRVHFERCTFISCAPLTVVSDNNQSEFTMHNCRVLNAPNAINPPSVFDISHNHWINDSYLSTRTHAIYPYGFIERGIVTNNYGKNITDNFCKYKGNSAFVDRKSFFFFSGNQVDGAVSVLEVGSDTEVVHDLIHAVNNQGRNVSSVIRGYTLSDAEISGNILKVDHESIYTQADCVVLSSGTVGSAGALATTHGVSVHHNRAFNDSLWTAIFTHTVLPALGDTFTVGGETYTWVVGAPATNYEVKRGATVALCCAAMADALRGKPQALVYATPVKNAEIDDPSHVQASKSDETVQRVIVNGWRSFASSVTGTGITVDVATSTDHRDLLDSVVTAYSVVGPIDITDNYCRNGRMNMEIVRCIRPRIERNTNEGWVNPGGGLNAPWATYFQGNSYPRITGNRYLLTKVSDDTSARRLEANDGWPYIRDNEGVPSFASTKLLGHLMGAGGTVTAGTGRATSLIWFGDKDIGGAAPHTTVQGAPLTLQAGDTVVLNDNAGASATFTFVASGYVLGSRNFTTKANLIAEINADATVSPVFTATDPDALAYGYILITVDAVGTAGNAATCTVTTKSKTCLQMLTSAFYGGAATAIKTMAWTAYAGTLRFPQLNPLSTATAALAGYVAEADVIQSVGYIITHGAAAGTEKWSWQLP